MLVRAFRLLRVCGSEPKPSAGRICRPRFGERVQDRERAATYHLAAALQSCQGQAFERWGIQSPQLNHAAARQRLAGSELFEQSAKLVALPFVHRPFSGTALSECLVSVDEVAMIALSFYSARERPAAILCIGPHGPP